MRIFLGILFLLSTLQLACTTTGYKASSKGSFPKTTSTKKISPEDTPALENLGPIPHEINEKVLKWLEYFQGRGRGHMARYLQRSHRYLSVMKEILREEGVPEDLVYISLIESGFNPKALSRAGAVGYWQFVRDTGRRYGLRVNTYVDERRDPIASTRAAANYFKSLYNLFGNWYLAMASYNAGENRIKNAVMKYQTRDFWYLAHTKRLPRETINYVPKFLAAVTIAREPYRYGFVDLNYADPLEFDTLALSYGINLKTLARHMSVKLSTLKRLNPSLRTNYVPVYSRGASLLRVPRGTQLKATMVLSKSRQKTPKNYKAATYRVRRGDTLSHIAHRFKTSVSHLRGLNNISSRSLIRVGQVLKIPGRGRVSKKASPRNKRRKVASKKGYTYHFVKTGENLYLIAKKYKITIQRLKNLNGLRRSLIRPGQSLIVRTP